MAIKKIKSTKARESLSQIMDEAFNKGNDFIVERGSKPMIAIISYEEYKRYRNERENDFKVFDEIWERNKNLKFEDAEENIKKAIEEVRTAGKS